MSKNENSCHLSDRETEDRVAEIIERIRDCGMRRTDALDSLLRAMLSHHKPFTLAQLGETPGLSDRDQATIYRLVTKLRSMGVVRQLSLGEHGNFFQLLLPDHHHDYMVCRRCGTVVEVPFACVLGDIEQRLQEKLGWRDLNHSLVFEGLCPDCSVDPNVQ